jgi:hypothetical protein
LSKQFHVGRLVNVVPKHFDCLPDGHIEQDTVVLVGPEIRRISFGRLKAPDEAGALIGEGIDFVQSGNESLHQFVIKWRLDSTDVDLGYVVRGHPIVSPLPNRITTTWSDLKNCRFGAAGSGERLQLDLF